MAREKIVGGWERRDGGGRPSGGECGESGLRGDGIGGEAKEGGQDVEQSLIYGLIFPGVRSQLILRFNCFVTRRGPPPTEGSFDLIKRIRRMSPRSPAHKRTKSLRGGSQEGEKTFLLVFTYDRRPFVAAGHAISLPLVSSAPIRIILGARRSIVASVRSKNMLYLSLTKKKEKVGKKRRKKESETREKFFLLRKK